MSEEEENLEEISTANDDEEGETAATNETENASEVVTENVGEVVTETVGEVVTENVEIEPEKIFEVEAGIIEVEAENVGEEESRTGITASEISEAGEEILTEEGEVGEEEEEEEEEDEEESIESEGSEEGSEEGERVSRRRKRMIGRIRYEPEEDEGRISGDFTVLDTTNISTTSPKSIISYHELAEGEGEGGEEESEESEEEEKPDKKKEEEKVPVDREPYYALYRMMIPERNAKRIKNNFLQRKMAEFFRKRKMEHVLKETDHQIDSQERYDRKLDALANLRELDDRERNSVTAEINDLRAQRDEQLEVFNAHFTAIQHKEKEIGIGLIHTKTGKPLSDKVVERLISRQNSKTLEIASMRLVYIKLRNRIAEKKIALHKLDTIGDNLHLIDYEQLKIENTSHNDKIEERDEELVNLRVKCSVSMQCLAHVREKSAALQLDLMSLTKRYDEVKDDASECRERLNLVKQERDCFRISTAKMIEDSGLLTKPKLLVDMEESLEEIVNLEKQLEHNKDAYIKTKESLKNIKKNIQNLSTQGNDSKRTKGNSKLKVFRGRPTIVSNILPNN